MNRAGRIRKVIPGAPDDLVTALAAKPAAEVDMIIAAMRQARRDALDQDKARRRQRVADRRKYRHVEDDQQADATERQTLALARRAGASLDTLRRLKEHYDDGPSVLALAVAGLHAQGYSDGEIGQALGITRQAVWKRFPRQPQVDTDPAVNDLCEQTSGPAQQGDRAG